MLLLMEVFYVVVGVNWFLMVGNGDIFIIFFLLLNSEQLFKRVMESSFGSSNLCNCIGFFLDG